MTSEPFGLKFGASCSDYQVAQELGQGKFQVIPPRSHPLLNQYYVQASRATGIVWVKGISDIIENDNYGATTKALVDRLAGQLSQRYGSGRKTDTLLHGSIWNEPKEWMNSLGAHERIYSYIWDTGTLSSAVDDLETIFVGATGVSHTSALVVLEYASKEMKKAEAEIDSEMADLL